MLTGSLINNPSKLLAPKHDFWSVLRRKNPCPKAWFFGQFLMQKSAKKSLPRVIIFGQFLMKRLSIILVQLMIFGGFFGWEADQKIYRQQTHFGHILMQKNLSLRPCFFGWLLIEKSTKNLCSRSWFSKATFDQPLIEKSLSQVMVLRLAALVVVSALLILVLTALDSGGAGGGSHWWRRWY